MKSFVIFFSSMRNDFILCTCIKSIQHLLSKAEIFFVYLKSQISVLVLRNQHYNFGGKLGNVRVGLLH